MALIFGKQLKGNFTGSLLGTASYADDATHAFTSSYVNPLQQDIQVTGSIFISGSNINLTGGIFSGSGANLYDVPAQAITGLNLSQISTGSIVGSTTLNPTASFQVVSGSTSLLRVNSTGGVTATSFTGSLFGTASWAVSSSYALNGGTPSAELIQTTPATIWTFTHNLGTRYPIITVYDNLDRIVLPQEIEALNPSTSRITFPTLESGRAVAAGGNFLGVTSTIVTGSNFADFATSASFATSAQQAVTASYSLGGSGSFVGTFSGSFQGINPISGDIRVIPQSNVVGQTLVNIPNLTLNGSTGETYLIDIFLRVVGSGNGGTKFALSYPGQDCQANIHGNRTQDNFHSFPFTGSDILVNNAFGTSTAGTITVVQIRGTITFLTNGTLTPRFQASSVGQTQTILSGSYGIYSKV